MKVNFSLKIENQTKHTFYFNIRFNASFNYVKVQREGTVAETQHYDLREMLLNTESIVSWSN